VNIYRNGMMVSSFEPNDGVYTDAIYSSGTYTYQICPPGPPGSPECSNSVTVTF